MGTEALDDLLKQWKQAELPVERSTGQILQHLIRMQAEIDEGKRRRVELETAIQAGNLNWANLKLDVDQVMRHTGLKPRRGRKSKNK